MKNLSVKKMVFVAIMGALSAVLLVFNFPLPFAPSFMKLDVCAIPCLFVTFYMGPLAGCMSVVVRVLINLLLEGTSSAFVGELSNILGGVLFVLPAGLIYKKNHTKKGAIIAMLVATLIASVGYVFINAYILFPMYSNLYHMPMEVIISLGNKVNSHINDLTTMLLYSVLPFNLFKHSLTSLITYLVYKRLGNSFNNIFR